VSRAILDGHLLRDLLANDVPDGLATVLAAYQPATTNLFLYRLSRSVQTPRPRPTSTRWPGGGQ
jgi:hypothetical protein